MSGSETTREAVLRLFKDEGVVDGTLLSQRAAGVTGCSIRNARGVVQRLRETGMLPGLVYRGAKRPTTPSSASAATEGEVPTGGRSLTELAEKYDHSLIIPQKIKEAIETHLMPRKWLWDYEMRQIVGVPTNRWRRYADHFEDHQSRIDNKIVWHDPAIRGDIERMKAT